MADRALTDTAPPRGRGLGAGALVLVFLLALLVRLAYLVEIRGTPLGQLLVLDAETYDRFARRVLAGRFCGEDVYAMNALYPYFVAAVYRVAGAAPLAVFLAQAALDAATAALAAWLGARLVSPGAGALAGALVALDAPLVLYTGTLLTPTTITFLCTAGAAALVRARGRTAGVDRRGAAWAAGAGLACGLATLGRGNNALFLPLGLGCLAWAPRGVRGRAPAAAAFAVAFLAPVALVVARNFAVEGRWVPVAANYAALYVGHNPAATGLFVAPPGIGGGEYAQEVGAMRAAVGRAVGHPVTLAESAHWLFAQALAYAGTHPWAELRLLALKLRYALSGLESPTNLGLDFARDWSPLLRRLPVGWWLLAPLGAMGLVRARGRMRELAPVLALVAVPLVTCLAVFVASEYRVPAVPGLAVLAALGLVALGLGPGRARGIGLAVGAVFLALALARPPVLARQANRAGDDVNFGTVYARQGRWVAARVLYERAVEADPGNGFAWRGLAVTRAQLDDPEGAARAAERARALGALPAR